MAIRRNHGLAPLVALLTESVDRNHLEIDPLATYKAVALLTESVDRNLPLISITVRAGVALLTESVDRNVVLEA